MTPPTPRPALLEQYRRDGFVVVENLIPPDLLRGLQDETARLCAAARAGELRGGHFDVIPGATGEPELRRVTDPEEAAAVYAEVVRCPAVLDAAAELLGGTVRFDHAKLNFKPAGGGGALGWHQDFAFYPQTNDDMLAVGVMIEDCGPDNAPLSVVPGSHLGPVLDHHRDGQFVGVVGDRELNGAEKTARALTAPAGSVSIHHARTLHASGENRGARPRPLLLLNYFAADAFPIFHAPEWGEFNARLLRGGLVFTPRMVPVECKVPHPAPKPSGRHTTVSIYDLQEMAG